MASTFLITFGFESKAPQAAPVPVYAGYSHQDQFASIVAASLTGKFDHFMTGNSAAFSIMGVFSPRPKDPAELAPEEAAPAEDQAIRQKPKKPK